MTMREIGNGRSTCTHTANWGSQLAYLSWSLTDYYFTLGKISIEPLKKLLSPLRTRRRKEISPGRQLFRLGHTSYEKAVIISTP